MTDPVVSCPLYVDPWWHVHPPVGTFIAVLGLLGVLVPLYREWNSITPKERAAWMLAMFVLLGLEIRTLYLDRSEHDREQADARCEQLKSFQQIATTLGTAITTGQSQFNTTMTTFSSDESTRQQQFAETMNGFSRTESANQDRFQKLMDHQEEVADSLNGTLSPGSDPDPDPVRQCGAYGPKDTVIMYGKNDDTLITDSMPVNLVKSQSRGVLLSMSRLDNGNVVLTGDVRGRDGKIIVRLDTRGYVINHSGFLEVNKDKHSLRVSDDYGDEVLNLRYMNPQVIKVSMPQLGGPGVHIHCFTARGLHGFDSIFGTP